MTQTKTRKALSPGRVEREKLRTVFGMLQEDGSKRRWTDLEKQARNMKMSIRTLKKNLDKLETAELITRYVDTSTRPPGVYYSRYKTRIRYSVEGPEGGRSYEPKLVWENTLESLNKEISELKNKNIEDAKQKLSELVMFNINEALKDTIKLFLRELKKEQGNIETFNRWMDVVVHPRLEMLLQLCIRHFDVTEQTKEKLSLWLKKLSDEEISRFLE
jgi:DNA-binding MarR family transcriptional regulator